jgi:DNA-binding XRE family transcriptional regulator
MESDRSMDQETCGLKLATSKTDLDELCRRLGYSNDSLAQELGVSRATIFNWKKDQQALPRLVSLALFALDIEPRLRNLLPIVQKKRV